LPAMVSPPKALAGSCGSTACNATSIAPSVQRAPATRSASHAFTVSGGSRVADINLSQEARVGINAVGKEPPLPNGCLTAADRGKLIAKQPPLYGWPQDEIPRPRSRTQSHYSIATRENSRGRVLRSPVQPATAVKVAVAARAKTQK
jgi:hypothetical protein